ncbi:MAG: hypothetical protein FWE07_04180 [Turicibacter sp.]|nr:hypothetical protein [Turicibacter sp.]
MLRKKKHFLLASATLMLLGGFSIVGSPSTVADANITCRVGAACMTSFGGRQDPNNGAHSQVRGVLTGAMSEINLTAQVTRIDVGTNSASGGAVATGRGFVSATSPWVRDPNNGSLRLTGFVR